MKATATLTPFSMPFFRSIGLAPAATLRMPSRTMAWARTVAVVVPSPAMSLVFVATSLASCAPMFSKGLARSISLAMVTPSLVIVGAPKRLSITTLRPRGPSVTRTALASLLTPASRPFRASSWYISFFAMSPSCERGGGAPRGRRLRALARVWLLLLAGGGGDLGQHVTAGQDQHVFAVD